MNRKVLNYNTEIPSRSDITPEPIFPGAIGPIATAGLKLFCPEDIQL